MEYYQELLLNIIEFMLNYVNSNLLQTMYYDLYDEIYEETNEVFYTQILGNVIISCLHKIFSIKLIILSLAQAELTTAPTPATGSPVPALSPAKPSRPWSSLRSSRRTRTEAAD